MRHLVLGIVAHVDAGKTTLSEALLYRTGVVRKLGRVDHGDSTLDYSALERQRGITIYAKEAVIQHGDTSFTLLDTPGHVDFSAEAERTMQVLDYALLVIDGTSGVQSHTETLWDLLARYRVPTFIFVNKTDRAEATREELCAQLAERLDAGCLDFSAGAPVEACAMTDERALDEYLETGELSRETLRRLVAERGVFPCCFGSALKLEGIDELLDGLAALSVERDWPAAFGARVFKISHDEQGNRLAWLKVTGGELHARQALEVAVPSGLAVGAGAGAVAGAGAGIVALGHGTLQAWTEKANQLRIYTGGRFATTDAARAGQVVAVTGLAHAQVGCALGAEEEPPRPVIAPVLSSKVLLEGEDVHKVHAALWELTDEDPQLGVTWDEELQELRVSLMGTVQLEALQATLRDRFGLGVGFGPGGILYRETITAPVLGIGHFEPLRHYAEAQFLLEPLPAGSGVVFGSRCHVDDLDLNWQRLALTNAMERAHRGVLTGAPITDVRITLVAGRAHLKHTEGGDFRQAVYRAIRQGLMQARAQGQAVLLEPLYHFALTVPADCIGRAMADLQQMSATFDPPAAAGADRLRLEGTVPASEVGDYAVALAAYTHGQGSLALRFDSYAPCHDAAAVIERAAYDPVADLPNTPDSVFCAHGAGYNVGWQDVPAHAHCGYDPARLTAWRPADASFFGA